MILIIKNQQIKFQKILLKKQSIVAPQIMSLLFLLNLKKKFKKKLEKQKMSKTKTKLVKNDDKKRRNLRKRQQKDMWKSDIQKGSEQLPQNGAKLKRSNSSGAILRNSLSSNFNPEQISPENNDHNLRKWKQQLQKNSRKALLEKENSIADKRKSGNLLNSDFLDNKENPSGRDSAVSPVLLNSSTNHGSLSDNDGKTEPENLEWNTENNRTPYTMLRRSRSLGTSDYN